MMSPEPSPLYCRPEAFDTLARELDAIDTTRGLLRCATAVSLQQMPTVSLDDVEAEVDALASQISERLRSDQPRARLAHAHAVLFDEARFTGNTEDYYHPANSYLSRILITRRGLPITLVLLYKAVMEAVGLQVRGINAPGHFLAGIVDPGLMVSSGGGGGGGGRDGVMPLLIDPFDGGRLLTREEAFARIEQIAGGAVTRDDALLRPATHTDWLIRIIQNLVHAFERLDRRQDRAAMLEMRALVESVQ